MTLVEFLLARIAEDEKFAVMDWPAGRAWSGSGLPPDPTRIVTECEAKRRIVQRYSVPDPHDEPGCRDCDMLRLLALPHADHPDYREEWRP